MNRVKQFLKWTKGAKIFFLLTVFFLFINTFLDTVVPLFISHLIDNILDTESSPLPKAVDSWLSKDTVAKEIFFVAVVFLGLSFFRAIFIFSRRAINAVFSEKISFNLRNSLYKHLQNLSFSYHSKAETGDLIQRCTTDVDTYKTFMGEQLIQILRLVSLMVFSVIQMIRFNISLTVISLISSPIIFLSSIIYFKYVKNVFKEVESEEGSMTTTLQENLTGIRVVKAFGREKYELEKFEKYSYGYTRKNEKLINLMAIYWSSTDFIIFIQYATTSIIGIYLAVKGTLTVGEFTAFLAYVSYIVWPMRQLGRIVGDMGKTTVALDRIDEIMNTSIEYEEEKLRKDEIDGDVEFDNVTFQFDDDDKPLLKNISFSVGKGETVAIIGRTGSGKSTLINLMVRLLDYKEGSIKYSGTDIKELDKKWVRKNVGIILQEPFLYSKSVYDNIGIMNKKAGKSLVEKAASIASVHDDILDFEKGYDTMVGERGVTLSGGQKQRVAIARMLLDDKPILIFDDSLSAVDTETDIRIREALNEHWKNTTVFIITHRITTAMEADKIIVLEKGVLEEIGTHEELLTNDGIYKTLWDIQTKLKLDFNDELRVGE